MKKMTKENVIQVLRLVTDEALLKYKAQIRGIFGSVARGDETEYSDIDVLVDFTEKVFYNRQRRQARLGYLSPVVYEKKFHERRLVA